MSWANQYIGIPYVEYGQSFEGCDCWGLVKLVYKNELLIDLKDHMCSNYHNDRQTALLTEAAHWQRVDTAKIIPFDIIAFKYGRIIGHVGIIIDKIRFLHVQDDIKACAESFVHEPYSKRIAGVYRYVS